MKALVYNGTLKVSVQDVPDATIADPRDAVITLTTSNICGSDLHMYEGRTNVEEGKILGHENMGIVSAVGPGVHTFAVGDRVSVPFNIGCGTCRNCTSKWTSFCTKMNPIPGMDGAAYGFAGMGPYDGGQAQFLRVPHADFNLLRLPPGKEHENDFTMLSDVFPTGWHGVQLSGQRPGESVVVFGAGPVGLMAAHSAMIRGASQVFVVDKQADRLALAEGYGCTPVDYSAVDVAETLMDATGGYGVDRGVEAVGYQAQDASGDEHPEMTINLLFACVRATGGIGVVGVYVPQDPGAGTEDVKQGKLALDFGLFWSKGQTMGTGQANVKAYNRELRDLIVAGRAQPGKIVSHELPLEDAATGYDQFDKRVDGWTKVLLKPAA